MKRIERRDFLTVAGALGLAAVVPGCGGGNPDSTTPGDANGAFDSGSGGGASTVPGNTGANGRVIVVGGGMAGAAAAKYLRLWGGTGVQVTLVEREPNYVSNIFSNLVLNGQRTLDSLRYSYTNLASKYGITVRPGTVTTIDAPGKRITLAGGATLPYDRLIIAPGVEFDVLPGLESAAAQARVVHAWQAGPQTTTLRNQLVAMRTGGTFIMTIPAAPYRCPPGPYERACLVADWLQRNKPGSRVIVLDANPAIVAERHTFETAFTGIFRNTVTYVPNAPVTSIDAAATPIVVRTPLGNFSGDVVNAIPPHRAGQVVTANGLANAGGGRWAGVNVLSYESTAAPGVHVIGDATFATPQPKAGHIGNQQGKVCADAIVRLLAGGQPDPAPVTNSACYSPITASTASWLTAVFHYDPVARNMALFGQIAEADGPTSDSYKAMSTWFNTLMGETFA